MPAVHEHATLEDAGEELLRRALHAENWLLGQDGMLALPSTLQAQVEGVRVAACLWVTPALEVELRICFRGPQLSPTRAADLLERFVARRMPLTPHTEWRVEVDDRRWIHFCRRFSPAALIA